MTEKDNEIIDKEELRKSLTGMFSEEEINELIEKAEKEGKFGAKKEKEDPEDEDEDDEGGDEKAEMEKAYGELKSMHEGYSAKKSEFLDKFGKVPGFKTPDFDVKVKAVENDIEKSFDSDKFSTNIQKSFTDKLDEIEKSIQKSYEDKFETIQKSIDSIGNKFEEFLNAPNPLKSIVGNYSFIEKGIKTNEDGKTIVRYGNKKAVQDQIMKAIDVVKEEDQKEMLRTGLSNLTVTGNCSPKVYGIVEKALDIEFEK
jgi:hypothetical protein